MNDAVSMNACFACERLYLHVPIRQLTIPFVVKTIRHFTVQPTFHYTNTWHTHSGDYLMMRVLCQYKPTLNSKQTPINKRTGVFCQMSLLSILPVSGNLLGLPIVGVGLVTSNIVAVEVVEAVAVGEVVGVMVSAVCVIASAVWVNSSFDPLPDDPLPDDPPPDMGCVGVWGTVVFVGGTFADVGIACGPFIACTASGKHNPIRDINTYAKTPHP